MVTKEMKTYGRVVAELDYNIYKSYIGAIRSNLPHHIFISPEIINVGGRKIARLWCRYPKAGETAVRKALGEYLQY